MRSKLTCTIPSHRDSLAAYSSTLHSGSPELRSKVQRGCYCMYNSLEVTPQPCHRCTFELEWQETVPTTTPSADSVCYNIKLTSPTLIQFSQCLLLVPTLEASLTFTKTHFLCGKIMAIPQVHHNPKSLIVNTLPVNRKFINPLIICEIIFLL